MPICKVCGNSERFKGEFQGDTLFKFVCNFDKEGEMQDIALVKEKDFKKVEPHFKIEACWNCSSHDIETTGGKTKEYTVPCEKCQVHLKISNPINDKRYHLRCPQCGQKFYHVALFR